MMIALMAVYLVLLVRPGMVTFNLFLAAKPTHVIRTILLREVVILNYVKPF
jgi:hypothetical protein